MKNTYLIGAIIIILLVVVVIFGSKIGRQTQMAEKTMNASFEVIPIMHASAVLKWKDATIYTDPTGGLTSFEGQSPADIILVTDIHGDHFSTTSLNATVGTAKIIVPQAVMDLMPQNLAAYTKVLKNGETITEQGFKITGIPMYNLPESPEARHTKGRGNGYVIEKDGFRVYVAGDTGGIQEMKSLKNIDVAFVPMNPPFTMTVEEAADAVLEFKPQKVYPYHYRGQDGLNDINKFKELVNSKNKDIEVVLLNWYPEIINK